MKYVIFNEFIEAHNSFVVIQADNPDGDSLASSLLLESLLENHGKNVSMYCGVEIPSYLRYMDGWDRVQKELPKQFEATIIVDTSAISLLDSLGKNNLIHSVKAKPCMIVDHHGTKPSIDFASALLIEPAVSSAEIIHRAVKDLKWSLTKEEAELTAFSILSDSLGLTSQAVSSETLRAMADLVDCGVTLAELDERRKSLSRKSPALVNYKGRLLQRIDYSFDSRIATIVIPWDEIQEYSHSYNPSMLVIDEMRMTEGVLVAVAFKQYPDGKVTAKIRSNYGISIADKVAEHFGGGGHAYAAGFKITDGRTLDTIKVECNVFIGKILDEIQERTSRETVQHTF